MNCYLFFKYCSVSFRNMATKRKLNHFIWKMTIILKIQITLQIIRNIKINDGNISKEMFLFNYDILFGNENFYVRTLVFYLSIKSVLTYGNSRFVLIWCYVYQKMLFVWNNLIFMKIFFYFRYSHTNIYFKWKLIIVTVYD